MLDAYERPVHGCPYAVLIPLVSILHVLAPSLQFLIQARERDRRLTHAHERDRRRASRGAAAHRSAADDAATPTCRSHGTAYSSAIPAGCASITPFFERSPRAAPRTPCYGHRFLINSLSLSLSLSLPLSLSHTHTHCGGRELDVWRPPDVRTPALLALVPPAPGRRVLTHVCESLPSSVE